jgi:transcription elongation factor SPT5
MKRSRFIDDIAEVDDEDDEDEDEGEGMDDLIDDQGEVPDAADLAEVRRAIREAEIQAQKDEEINPEELQKYLQERFGRDRMAAYHASEGEPAGGAVSQQALMPTAKDPKLWVIRCAEGAEREVVVCLLQKCYDYATRGQPLLIKSVFCRDQLKGYLYVEAYKADHVRGALKGLRGVFHGTPPKLVPLLEMVSAITIPRAATRAAQPGSWVRPKTGVYKGDLAKVTSVDVNGGRATIRLVPRLDFANMAARRAEGRRGFDKAAKVRPAARAFNPDEARSFQLDVMQTRDRETGELMQILNNSQRFSKGYLVKTVAMKGLTLEEGLPPLDELQRFNAAQNDGDDGASGSGAGGGATADLTKLVQELGVDAAAALEDAANAKFIKADRVMVREGDLKGILGRVELVTEDGQVMVRPIDDSLGDFKEAIGFAPRELYKWFDSGDHVKVLNGSHSGETGMVVNVDEGVCYVLTDQTREEIKVFTRDLVAAVAAPTTQDKIGDYDLFDLVVLDSQTVGVIVGIEKDTCRVLTNAGDPGKPDVRVCRLPDVKRKINNRRASAQDKARNEININDIIQVVEGPMNGRAGTVKHIMRGFIFIQSREFPEFSGYACVLARSCMVRGGLNRLQDTTAGGVLATPHASRILATPGFGGGVTASPAHHSQRGGSGGGGGGAGGGYAGRLSTQQDRQLEGQDVTIKTGPYRGMRGKVKSATATHLRVELEAQMKQVTVERAHLALAGRIAAPRAPMGMGMGVGMGGGYGMPTAAPGGRTPAHWSMGGGFGGAGGGGGGVTATPAHYSSMATPMHPGMTPGRDSVTKTPAYDPAWAATPAYAGFGGGGGGGNDGYNAPNTSLPTVPGYGTTPATGDMHTIPAHGNIPGYGSQYGATPASAGRTAPITGGAAADGGGGGSGSSGGGPIAGTSVQDWVGLEVTLPSGEHAAVRSVGTDGTASVQLGRSDPDGKVVFTNGSMQSTPVGDLKLVLAAKGDRARVLLGQHRGAESMIGVIDGPDAFITINGMTVVPAETCAKLAA